MLLREKLTIYVKPTEACNLKCLHCYNRHQDQQSVLDLNRFRKFMASIAEHLYWAKKSVSLDVVLHGGEPTIVGSKMLKDICNIIAPKFAHDRVKFAMQTNLTLMDEGFIPFVKETLGGELGTSYSPGLRFVGQPDMELLWKNNLEKCLDAGISVYLVISLSKQYIENTEPIELINFLVKSRVTGFHFEPITKNGQAAQNWDWIVPSAKAYDAWKAEFAKDFIETDSFIHFQESEIVRKAKTFFDGTFVGCNCRDCMLTVMTINADGTIGLCPNVSKEVVISTIDDAFSAFVDSPVRQLLIVDERKKRQGCLDCSYFQVCNGGCSQTQECYEGPMFYRELELGLGRNGMFKDFVKSYERNENYCSERKS